MTWTGDGMNLTEAATGAETPMATQLVTTSVRNLSSLVAFLLSFGALRNWLKLLVFGSGVESIRRLLLYLYYTIPEYFWVTANFPEDDDAYGKLFLAPETRLMSGTDWMMVWLSKHSAWAKARQVEISTRSFGSEEMVSVTVPGEETDGALSLLSSRKIAYLPAGKRTFSTWYHGRYMLITRLQEQTGRRGAREEILRISILARSHRVLNELVLQAKKQYMAALQERISIWVSDSRNNWDCVTSRPKRSLKSIILDPGVAELLVDDARDFLSSRRWYAARGIPFRRGYLLYGAPGTGKTSIITSIAGELELDIYIIQLSRSGMDDAALSTLISDLPEKCIALIEDIDAAFTTNLNRDEPSPATASPEDADPDDPAHAGTSGTTGRLSLSGLLNALDGIAAQEGRLLYATTNKYEALDPALSRPGRMDIHVEFKRASRHQAERLFFVFYLPPGEDGGEGTKNKEKENESEAAKLRRARRRAPPLPRGRVVELAKRFAAAIPEREVSVAELQGFLMGYKGRPVEAVDAVGQWLVDEQEARAKREGVEEVERMNGV
ncbi:P-loop containing nucleoside triphosphate hydrolase protein [Roridomyces roridus]|uniref:P-loop containing nucleoside triphosphate hydrolase protein n=1 Tax=Roridomyces roridus TaxID=1738132 RepID=A0AAD7BNB0_9AGAR|nr:P-loop containing nucleoside triphosphate hydrolase protein [Roridomyces roridus]